MLDNKTNKIKYKNIVRVSLSLFVGHKDSCLFRSADQSDHLQVFLYDSSFSRRSDSTNW